jgi:hypothetical protein
MIDCNHIYTLGAERGNSAVLNGKCSICGERAANPMSPTMQPFDHLDPPLIGLEKMQSGEVDKVFRATCPQCDGRVWLFAPSGKGIYEGSKEIDPDARVCKSCGYVHWLRGPNTSEVVPLPHHEPAYPSKKDRVRALLFAFLASPRPIITSQGLLADGSQMLEIAKAFDDEIEAIK